MGWQTDLVESLTHPASERIPMMICKRQALKGEQVQLVVRNGCLAADCQHIGGEIVKIEHNRVTSFPQKQ